MCDSILDLISNVFPFIRNKDIVADKEPFLKGESLLTKEEITLME